MFVFVVPFKSRSCCSDWSMATRLCTDAIRSMLAGPPSVKVILACSEPPEQLPRDSRLIVKTLARPTPQTRQEMMEDKYFKIKAGLTLAREFAPTWLMRADADDRISHRLVPFIEQQKPHGAWYSEIGWLHRIGSKYVVKQRNFHMFCGTSCVSYVSAAELPSFVEQPSESFYLLTQGHHMTVDFLRRSGVPTRPVPFATTVYVTDSGENWSGPRLTNLQSMRARLKCALNTRPLTKSVRREFGLY